MIKVVAPAQQHPANRRLADFHRYWAESHGPLFANTTRLRRYVQHLTLPEAYGMDPAPTFDGVSMFWYDELDREDAPAADPEVAQLLRAVLGTSPAIAPSPQPPTADSSLLRAVLKDDVQLFERSLSWPMHHKRAFVAAEEQVIVDGPTSPEMVKAIFIVSKLPGLTASEFFAHWRHRHGALASRIPGLRRYVQNHAVLEAYAGGGHTHDGWAELWFDDLDALRRAAASREWRATREHGEMLFARPIGVGVARERVQKEIDWTYNDWSVGAMELEEIRQRLSYQGYRELAGHPDGPAKIKAAAARQALAVWTDEHLVTIDDTDIDIRPQR